MNYKDMGLSELSCYAAGEIDDYTLNRGRESDATIELSLRMKRFSEEKSTQIDPRNGLMYYQIFEKDKSIKTVDNLQDRILQIAQELSSVKTLSKKRLKSLRALCLVISDVAEAYEDYHPNYLVA